jgi:hypothetical protein
MSTAGPATVLALVGAVKFANPNCRADRFSLWFRGPVAAGMPPRKPRNRIACASSDERRGRASRDSDRSAAELGLHPYGERMGQESRAREADRLPQGRGCRRLPRLAFSGMQQPARSIPHNRGGSAPFGNYARIIPNPECRGCRCLDVRHATSSALKRIKVRQVAKSRRYSSDPQGLSAARAKGRPRRVFIRAFIAHGQSGP